MPEASQSNRREAALLRANALIMEALDVLDAHDGSPEAAALLELALAKMRQQISGNASGSE